MKDPEDESSFLDTLTLEEAEAMITRGQICKGMIPKVKACMRARRSGVDTACILDGTERHIILQEFLTGVNTGTIINA